MLQSQSQSEFVEGPWEKLCFPWLGLGFLALKEFLVFITVKLSTFKFLPDPLEKQGFINAK